MPYFSVIVPIYNVEAYLPRCLDSILHQSYEDFELILVDDGSPDGCPALCDRYAAQDGRVRIIHKKNGGLVSARNAGLQAATGQFVVYVDGDDWVSEKMLETVYDSVCARYADVDMVIFGIEKVCEGRRVAIEASFEEGYYAKQRLCDEVYPYMMYDPRKPFCHGFLFPAACGKAFRTKLLQEHYCRDERIRMGEDNAFVFECAYYARALYYCPVTLHFYNRLNESSISSSYDAGRFRNNIYLTNYLCSRLGGQGPVMDAQLNAFKAYWLIMAVFHEVKKGRKIGEAARHISGELRETKTLDGISMHGLPLTSKCFLLLLRLHLYRLALIGADVVNTVRKSD